ncbi:ABC transporter ATP-binding protein [Sphaerobacter thermophilus]|jgi:ABC-type multidrug transport system ATPase subunit|uniref:ABC transporter related protein n=1 Tax=Sphaerobacter thermophilus (strain ATCC 49802 / DSM 20745 / KCCM 41009 / NCIMB 13125 / S 6022) TaxID=479434 RepID=D1C686_SPHTD|nr:ABC transporter ATP-binding protein [Sphaerobacter thermophilus]ACZ37624.1 ABC transporter related protein [Sphaerobacter thermophilus DSM 20745]
MTMDFAIETDGLTKRYSEHILAVDGVTLRVRRGEVYGFVGPNGAGKTTTMRMLVGLIRPSAGQARVLGKPPGSPDSLARVGAMIEAPGFYPFLSGRDNLRVMARHAGVPEKRLDAVLEQVGLADRAGDPFGTYSMGMKQRLGLAAALLKDPELLILDEPTSGLDPEGIAEMRDFVRQLTQGERTVFLSSHLMTEVEQICDRIGIIRRGRLVAEGTLDELRGQPELHLRATPIDRARRMVESLPYVERLIADDGKLVLTMDLQRAGELNRQLVSADVEVTELTPARTSLEEVYFDLVQAEQAGDVEGDTYRG